MMYAFEMDLGGMKNLTKVHLDGSGIQETLRLL
jgi:hypothetical protein